MYKRHTELSESLEAMRRFSETYAKITNTFFCSLPDVTSMVIVGLGTNRHKYGAPLCPCRNYEVDTAEVDSAYWNCPCVPMRERKECHCMLFLPPESDYASYSQFINPKTFDNEIRIPGSVLR